MCGRLQKGDQIIAATVLQEFYLQVGLPALHKQP